MNKKNLSIRKTLLLINSFFENQFETIFPIIILFVLLVSLDYLSEILVEKKEALDYSGYKKSVEKRKKELIRIYKKFGCILTIFVAISVDYIIFIFLKDTEFNYKNTLFSLLILIWFTLNELLSILENIKRIGINLPIFLINVLKDIKKYFKYK